MITTNFFAADIENLTDARYFAAWGAAWMSFSIDNKDVQTKELLRIKEIIDWVDGPKMALRFPEEMPAEQLMEIAVELKVDGIIIDEKSADQLTSFGQDIKLIIPKKSVAEIEDCAFDYILWNVDSADQILEIPSELKEEYQIYVDTDWDSSFISKNASVFNHLGLVLKGGAEEKVGYKSYDDLDEIFEALENIED